MLRRRRRHPWRLRGCSFLVATTLLALGCAPPAPPVAGYVARPGFDASRALLEAPDVQARFLVPKRGRRLAFGGFDAAEPIIVVERRSQRIALLVEQMVYHRVAQGDLGGAPFVVAFSADNHSAVGIDPVVGGQLRHFSAGGIHGGVVLLIDDETKTYWDAITGRALYGRDVRGALETFPLRVMRVDAAVARWPDLQVAVSDPGFFANVFSQVAGDVFAKDRDPSADVRDTMGAVDPRASAMTSGLGVVVRGTARFYPFERLTRHGVVHDWVAGRRLLVRWDPEQGPPRAQWAQRDELPPQLLSRWYGFSAAYPGCDLYTPDAAEKRIAAAQGRSLPRAVDLAVEGQITIVEYFASWCEPCAELSARLDDYRSRNASVVVRRIDVSDWSEESLARSIVGYAELPTIELFDENRRSIARLGGKDALAFERVIEQHTPERPGEAERWVPDAP